MKPDSFSWFDNHAIGICAGTLSAMSFALTAVLVNIVADTIPATEVTFVRGMVGILIIFPFVKHRLGSLANRASVSVWVRAVAGAISMLCFTWNLQHTDVGTANILFNLSLIFVLLAEYATGQSGSSFRNIAFMILAAAGIGLYWHGNRTIVSNRVLIVGLVGAVSVTIAYAALNKASRKIDPWLIVWTLCLMAIPVALLAKSGDWNLPSAKAILILFVISIGSLFTHYLLNLSFSKLSLPVATALIPGSVVWGVLVMAVFQGLIPSPHAIAGVIIYAVGMGLLIADSKKSRVPQALPTDIVVKLVEPAKLGSNHRPSE